MGGHQLRPWKMEGTRVAARRLAESLRCRALSHSSWEEWPWYEMLLCWIYFYPLTQCLPFAVKLEALHKPYELIIYAGDNHGLTVNREDSDRRIIEGFRQHIEK